jgi:hypothetical protein
MTTPRNTKLARALWPGGGGEKATQPYPSNPECGISAGNYLYDDFVGSVYNGYTWGLLSVGTGSYTAALVASALGGQMELTATDYRLEFSYGNNVCNWDVPWACTWRGKIATVGASMRTRFGMADYSGTNSQVQFEYDPSYGTGLWRCVSTNSGVSTYFDAGTFDNGWHEFKMVCPRGEHALECHQFFLDGVFLGQNASNLTTASLAPWVHLSTVASTSTMKIDWVEMINGRA